MVVSVCMTGSLEVTPSTGSLICLGVSHLVSNHTSSSSIVLKFFNFLLAILVRYLSQKWLMIKIWGEVGTLVASVVALMTLGTLGSLVVTGKSQPWLN